MQERKKKIIIIISAEQEVFNLKQCSRSLRLKKKSRARKEFFQINDCNYPEIRVILKTSGEKEKKKKGSFRATIFPFTKEQRSTLTEAEGPRDISTGENRTITTANLKKKKKKRLLQFSPDNNVQIVECALIDSASGRSSSGISRSSEA